MGLNCLICLGITLDDVLEFLHAFVFFSQFEERESFLQLSRGGLVPLGKFCRTRS